MVIIQQRDEDLIVYGIILQYKQPDPGRTFHQRVRYRRPRKPFRRRVIRILLRKKTELTKNEKSESETFVRALRP